MHRKRRVKKSDVILIIMLVSVLGYVYWNSYLLVTYNVSLPDSINYGFYAAFVSELISYGRIKAKQEGSEVPARSDNSFMRDLNYTQTSESEFEKYDTTDRTKERG